MMLLVKKSTSGAVDQAESSRRGHYVSIEFLDEQVNGEGVGLGKEAIEEVGGNLVTRKRPRGIEEVSHQGDTSKKNADGVTGRGVNKTITIVGNRGIMTPTVDPRGKGVAVIVEVQPHERWTGNATVPMRAFQIFNLPQDTVAYVGRTREELADRCLSRASRVSIFFVIL